MRNVVCIYGSFSFRFPSLTSASRNVGDFTWIFHLHHRCRFLLVCHFKFVNYSVEAIFKNHVFCNLLIMTIFKKKKTVGNTLLWYWDASPRSLCPYFKKSFNNSLANFHVTMYPTSSKMWLPNYWVWFYRHDYDGVALIMEKTACFHCISLTKAVAY